MGLPHPHPLLGDRRAGRALMYSKSEARRIAVVVLVPMPSRAVPPPPCRVARARAGSPHRTSPTVAATGAVYLGILVYGP